MTDDKTYDVNLTVTELYTLYECLAFVRKRIDETYQESELSRRREPIQDPLFVEASKLAYKLAKVESPDSKVTLQDFLNHGNYGLNN